MTGYLTPDFYQLVIAAKSGVDDNYGYEVWRLGSQYAAQDTSQGLPTLRLRGEDRYLDNKKIRVYRRSPQTRFRLMPTAFKRRENPEQLEQYKKLWSGESICSHPPRSFFQTWAARRSKKILYIALGQLSTVTLKKIRTFHVLDGHDVRAWAGRFI